jgi:hypothetical protein
MTYYEILAAHYTKPIPAGAPDPHIGHNWAPITRFFGEGTTWTSAIPVPLPTPPPPPNPEPFTGDLITEVVAKSERPYATGVLKLNALPYTDRGYVFTEIPEQYRGAELIRTANGDKRADHPEHLRFMLNAPGIVYVAFDARLTPQQGEKLPSWLREWEDTGTFINTTDVRRRVYAKEFPKGIIIIGGNEAATNNSSNYNVFAIPPSGPKETPVTEPEQETIIRETPR